MPNQIFGRRIEAYKILAASRVASEKHGTVDFTRDTNQIEDVRHRFAATDNVVKLVLPRDFLLQILDRVEVASMC